MRQKTFAALIGAAALTALPVHAQDLNFDVDEAQEAVDEMVGRVYVQQPVTPVPVADVVAKLQELGYTEIEDFDVEWDEYEIEATGPDGEEYEIEIDPATGRILQIEEDFF